MFKFKIFIALLVLILTACSTTYSNNNVTNSKFPQVTGENLLKETVQLPQALSKKKTILLLGFQQDSQFDIDRWLIGLDMTNTTIDVIEVPTIQGMFPRMFSTQINDGMRKGIPKSLWAGVITVYQDGDKLQQFTGNINPNNARVMLLDSDGVIRYFYDQGFSVKALNALRKAVKSH
ncbi:hypothetical protein Q4489_17880 [Thalassotalea sp. 1_MG-2023]|uniref:hypothetical protein n=1 Tax=Thalassotalea sp. 1_MG-2023 TaxID=3062680 RepID=UPI0026E34D9A|nr:hypothetical protein [Thalassotalea sp. 1_MG-2023]MDO6428876.1 hypothetical protein [Thalassotalea sp. 1_MG-2023]